MVNGNMLLTRITSRISKVISIMFLIQKSMQLYLYKKRRALKVHLIIIYIIDADTFVGGGSGGRTNAAREYGFRIPK